MKTALALALFAALTVLGGCANKEAQRQAKIQTELLSDKVTPVTFVTPKITGIESVVNVSGPLRTLNEVKVGAKIPGRLTMVSVRDGAPVRRGQVLAQVETQDIFEEIQQAHAALQVAESVRAQAQIQALMSPQQTQAAIRQAQAGLASAKARLSLVRKGPREQEKKQAEERVTSAKASLDKAKADLERYKKLHAQDAVSAMEVDAMQLVYDTSLSNYRSALEAYSALIEGNRPEEIRQAEEEVREADEVLRSARANSMMDWVRRQQVVAAEAQLRQARAQLRLAQMKLADAAITSPLDGYVSGETAQTGQVVSAGTPIATIVSLSGVYFEGQVPEREIAKVQVGQSASLTVDAYPNESFAATVIAIRPQADSLGRMFAARIAVNDASGRLRPGMFGRAKIVVARKSNAVLLPVDAVLSQGGASFVFVAADGKARRLKVRLGQTRNDMVEVLDFAPTQQVILQGKDLLTDGAPIREDKPKRGAA